MRRRHFDALRPVCPLCRSTLSIATVVRERGEDVLEGIVTCDGCAREYPIVDGIPIFVGAIRSWLSANPLQLLLRDDLSPEIESLIGDVLGSGSSFDTARQHAGIYADDHYSATGGSAARVLARALTLAAEIDEGPLLDAGCATGGTTFALAAQCERLTVGIDLNFAMLRVASSVLREGRARYARRRVGLVYDRVDVPVDVPPHSRELVDFWCCDATALPFPDATFPLANALNLVDCVPSPRDLLAELARVVRPARGKAIVATPYDWSPTATPVEGWLGGHSQRGPHRGASEPVLRQLLTDSGFEVMAEEESLPWRVRLHERSAVEYGVHVAVARRA